MESLLTPEALGGAGVGVGTIALIVFVRGVFQLGSFKVSVDELVTALKTTLQEHRDHLTSENKHHKRVEDFLARIELNSRAGIPRQVSGDHTPIHSFDAVNP